MRTYLGLLLALAAGRAAAEADFRRMSSDTTLDPATGAVAATVELEVMAADAPLSVFYVLLDPGLSATGATAAGMTVAVTQSPYLTWNALSVQLQPALAAGSRATVQLSYAGTLRCPGTTSAACDLARTAPGRFIAGSAFPYPVRTDGRAVAMPWELTLRLPPGQVAAVSAEQVSSQVEAGRSVTRWRMNRTAPFGITVFAGQLVAVPLSSGPVGVTHYHSPGDSAWAPRMALWPQRIVPFLESSTGRPFPFSQVSWVKLSNAHRELGYTTTALICLSDWHGSFDDALVEEEWAHEMAHTYFGISSWQPDHSRLITEGATVLTALDYRAERARPPDRELFLAHRLKEAELMLRYVRPGSAVPPLLVSAADAVPTEGLAIWAWAYSKAPAALDHLRVVMGDDAYARGMTAFLTACDGRACSVADFERELSAVGGAKVNAFFASSIYADTFPELSVGFSAPAARMPVQVTLEQQTSRPIVVELWLTLADGTRQRERVELSGRSQSFTFSTPSAVRSVRPNPRQDPLFWSRSAVQGDVDFDGRVDGLDVLACAALEGKKVEASFRPGQESLTGVDLDFDPRCDLAFDGSLEPGDLDALIARLGQGVRR
jgi:hypothetical protein